MQLESATDLHLLWFQNKKPTEAGFLEARNSGALAAAAKSSQALDHQARRRLAASASKPAPNNAMVPGSGIAVPGPPLPLFATKKVSNPPVALMAVAAKPTRLLPKPAPNANVCAAAACAASSANTKPELPVPTCVSVKLTGAGLRPADQYRLGFHLSYCSNSSDHFSTKTVRRFIQFVHRFRSLLPDSWIIPFFSRHRFPLHQHYFDASAYPQELGTAAAR